MFLVMLCRKMREWSKKEPKDLNKNLLRREMRYDLITIFFSISSCIESNISKGAVCLQV